MSASGIPTSTTATSRIGIAQGKADGAPAEPGSSPVPALFTGNASPPSLHPPVLPIGSRASRGLAAPAISHPVVDPRPVVGPRDMNEALQTIETKIKARLGGATAPPSVQIAITYGGKLVSAMALGTANLTTGAAPNDKTLYQINSMTKSLTDAAVMKLVEQGKLSLDTPVVSIVPEFANVRGPREVVEHITLRQLMSHSSLLTRDLTFDNWNGDHFWATHAWPSWQDYASRLHEAQIPRANTKHEFKYSNVGLAIMGQVVSRASGMPYADFVRTSIFEPLGMSDSMFTLDAVNEARAATGYSGPRLVDGKLTRSEEPIIRDPGALISVAGCRSTATDVAKWLSFLRDPRSVPGVLSSASVAAMRSPTVFDESNYAQVGFGLFSTPARIGTVTFGHTGSGVGFSSAMRETADGAWGIVVLSNDFTRQPNAYADIALSELADVAKPAPPNGAPPRVSEWASFLGTYVNTIGTVSTVRTNADGDLTIDGTLLTPVPGKADTFTITGGDRTGDIYEELFFERDATGAVINANVGGPTPEHSQHSYAKLPR